MASSNNRSSSVPSQKGGSFAQGSM
jgi:hypothetical protein